VCATEDVGSDGEGTMAEVAEGLEELEEPDGLLGLPKEVTSMPAAFRAGPRARVVFILFWSNGCFVSLVLVHVDAS